MKLSSLTRTVSSRLIVSFICVACPIAALAAAAPVAEHIDWLHLLMGLSGGLALFLFGMEQMSDALKSALGEQMKDLLARLTRNRFTGAITGAFVTAVVQSSSITITSPT